MQFPHPGPGEQLTQPRVGVGRFQQVGPYTSVVAYSLAARFDDGIARYISVHGVTMHEELPRSGTV
ncbi:hypothetical protein AMK29_18750 [Streptomyces sp. CB02261]|nr:hypothetical protein AMK29_18750 [Streptomyces sp. CB02261]